jgi:Neuraminidase (sialidase)
MKIMNLVLVIAYSADKEGKGGAIVGRISKDYGETWSESKTVINDKLKFGLAVAPYRLFVAFYKDKKISVKRYITAENK